MMKPLHFISDKLNSVITCLYSNERKRSKRMQKLIRQFCYANLLWLIAFLVDYGIELFQVINSERVTFMGLYIKSTEDSNTLYTVFGFTPKII